MAERVKAGDDNFEDGLRKAWVGEPPKLNSTVNLAEYDEKWPALYEREAVRIRGILGDRIRQLEHIGSTSVPGLAAKPIIDMLLVVDDSSDERSYVAAMESAGYRLVIREPAWHQHRVFKGPDTNINLHVFSTGNEQIQRHLIFRDWLRNHDDDRQHYEDVKRALAAKRWTYIQQYADAKDAVVAEIMARATAGKTDKSTIGQR